MLDCTFILKLGGDTIEPHPVFYISLCIVIVSAVLFTFAILYHRRLSKAVASLPYHERSDTMAQAQYYLKCSKIFLGFGVLASFVAMSSYH